MSRTNKGQPNREKLIFGWTAIRQQCGGVVRVGIVRAPTRAKAVDLTRERYPEPSWVIIVTRSLEGPVFDEIYSD